MDGPPAYDREIEAAEAIIEDQDQRIADAKRRRNAAIQCIKAACFKKAAELGNDRPLQVSIILSSCEDYYTLLVLSEIAMHTYSRIKWTFVI